MAKIFGTDEQKDKGKAEMMVKKSEKGLESEELNHSLTKIAKGAGIVFFGMVIGKILGYFYTIFVARLGAEQFGLLNLGFSVVSLLSIIAVLGLDQGILRYIPFYSARNDKRKVKGALLSSLFIALPLSILFALLVFIFSNQISTSFFHNIALAPLLRIFSFMIPLSTIGSILLASFRAFQRVEYEVGLKEITEKAIRLLATLLLVFFGFGVIGATYSYLISAVIVFVLAIFILEKKVFPIFARRIKAKYYAKELLSYSIPLLLTSVLVFVIVWIDTLMLGYFRTASEVGIYNAAHPTAALMFVLPTALISLFLPIITGLYSQKKHEQIKQLYKRVSKWIFLVSFPLFLVMIVFSRQIITIIFGNEYAAAATPLAILVFGYLLYSMSYTSSNILSMVKKTKLIFYINLIFAGSNILLNFLLIPRFGVNGAAIATTISYILGSLLYIFFGFNITKTYPFDKSFFKSFIAGLISIVSVFYLAKLILKPASLYGFVFFFLTFLVVYSGLLFLFRGFEKGDFEILKIIIKKIKSVKSENFKSFKYQIRDNYK